MRGALPSVVLASDAPQHAESKGIVSWLAGVSGTDAAVARLDAVVSKAAPGAVVWIHGVEPMAAEALGGGAVELLRRGRALLTGGAAALPAAVGLEPVTPGDSARLEWHDADDDLYLFPSFSSFPRIRGHGSFRGHPLFEGLGAGAFTWSAAEGEAFTRVAYLRPDWPTRARVLAVERSYIHLNAGRATIWEMDGDAGPVLCIGAYLPFAAAGGAFRENVQRLASNALRRAAGSAAAQGDRERVWVIRPVEAREDHSLPMPELPLLHEDLPSLEHSLRAAGPADGDAPFTVAGRRAFAAGGEARGVDEVWAHPVRLASGPRLAGASAETATVTPLGLERRLRVDGAPILERITVPRDAPVCLVEWRAVAEPVTVDVEWTSDLRLMWPYPATASSPLRWRRASRGVVVGSGAGEAAAFAFNRPPEQLTVTDASTEEVAAVRVRARLRLGRGESVRLAMAAAPAAQLDRSLRAANRAATAVLARSGATDRLLSEQLSFDAPDPLVTQAVEWAKVRLASYLVETPGIGRSLVAGYWASDDGWFGHGRPGYAWYFGRDAVWTALASLATGDFGAARDVLSFLGDHQALSGKILHECSSSGVVHYDAADASPLYLLLMARYLEWSGDIRFLQAQWQRVRAALAYCACTDRDGDGLIENTGEGHGWVEFGRLGGGDVTFYNAAIWTRATAELARAAEGIGQAEDARRLRRMAERAAEALEPTFRDPETGTWSINVRRGSGDAGGNGWRRLSVQTVMQGVPLLLGVVDPAAMGSWLDEVATDRFSAPWGVRMLPSDDPEYNPASYHGGAVWPLFTGWTSWAEYTAGRPEAAYRHWRMNVDQVFWRERGAWDEVLHGTEPEARGVCPDQAWSTAMVVSPLVYGLLGAEPDATRGRLVLRPRPPKEWERFRVRQLSVGDAGVTLTYRRQGSTHRFTLAQERGARPLQLVLAPELPGAGVAETRVDGAPADLGAHRVGERWRVSVQLVLDAERSLEVTMAP